MKILSTILVATAVAFGALTIGYTTPGQAQDAAAAWKARTDAMKGSGGAAARINKACLLYTSPSPRD